MFHSFLVITVIILVVVEIIGDYWRTYEFKFLIEINFFV